MLKIDNKKNSGLGAGVKPACKICTGDALSSQQTVKSWLVG